MTAIASLDALGQFLGEMAAILEDCRGDLRISAADVRTLAGAMRSAERCAVRIAEAQDGASRTGGDLFEFAATGGPSAAPHLGIPLPEFGDNVVWLSAAAYRPASQGSGA